MLTATTGNSWLLTHSFLDFILWRELFVERHSIKSKIQKHFSPKRGSSILGKTTHKQVKQTQNGFKGFEYNTPIPPKTRNSMQSIHFPLYQQAPEKHWKIVNAQKKISWPRRSFLNEDVRNTRQSLHFFCSHYLHNFKVNNLGINL